MDEQKDGGVKWFQEKMSGKQISEYPGKALYH